MFWNFRFIRVKVGLDGINHPAGGLTVPEIDFAGLRRFLGKHIQHVFFEIIKGTQAVGTLVDGDGAFGVGPEGQAGDAQISCFFLDSAGISEGETAVKYQIHKADVIYGFRNN